VAGKMLIIEESLSIKHKNGGTNRQLYNFFNISYDAAEHVITKVPDFSSILHRLLSVASIFFSRVFLVNQP
jgi:hypothetical protein